MIKPIQIINSVKNAAKAAEKTVTTNTKVVDEVAEELPHADAQLLQAYKGVIHTRLFQNFDEVAQSFKSKLGDYKEIVPKELFEKIEAAAEKSDFNFTKIISEHYAGLKDCKTVAEAKKMYPEIKVFNTDFEGEITEKLKSVIPTSLFDEVQNSKTLQEKVKIIDEFFDSKLGNVLKKWDIYPEVKQMQDSIALEMITGQFKGTAAPRNVAIFNYKEPLQYRLFREPNRDEIVLNILRDNYINANSYSGKIYKTVDGKEIAIERLNKYYDRLSGLDGNFLSFLKRYETTAQEFAALTSADKNIISSAILTESWRTSKLRADLGNMTAYKTDWSLIKPVWQKTMFPETTFYPTNKLIDAYLLNIFKAGKREAVEANPLAKFQEDPSMNKSKIMLLKKLYKYSKDLDTDKNILESRAFQNFKAQFDTEAMGKTIEGIEEHYKNSFFKFFWTPERRQRFAEAIHNNKEIAGKNIEILDNTFAEALNSALSV